jgi:hypothetical protein
VEIRFYIDPETDQPHIYKHGVTEEEVAWVLADPREVEQGRDDSLIAFGRMMSHKLLKVVYVPDVKEDSAFVVTAYRLTGKQLIAHNRRMRRH